MDQGIQLIDCDIAVGRGEIVSWLRDLRASASRPDKMLVVGHGDASHGTVVMVLDTGRDLGMDQVRLAVQDERE